MPNTNYRRPLNIAISDMEDLARQLGALAPRYENQGESTDALPIRARMRSAETDALIAGADPEDLRRRINAARHEGRIAAL